MSPIENKQIFITGGAGFIATTLIGKLVEANRIVVFDNFSRNSLDASPFRGHPNLNVVCGDVLDGEALKRAMAGSDIVVHCAAIAGIDTVTRSPTRTMRVNMVGSANVLQAAASLERCDRVLCFSTSEVFGQRAFRAAESDSTVIGAVGEPRWVYAVSKLAEEHLAKAYHLEHGLPSVTVRPFNVYGPGQVGEGALRNFILRALQNETIQIHGDGSQIRAWCYVDDMVEAVLRCLIEPKAVGESFNIGNSRAVATILDLARQTIRILHSKSKIEFVDRAMADVEVRIPNVNKARQLLGFEARIDLEDGIERTSKFFREKASG